ncbi:transposase [Streptomyces mirabilis]
MAELPKKNGWTLSERTGHVTADRMQWLLNGSVWDADRLRDAVRGYVITHLGCEDASLVIDHTQAQKKGTKSVGVAFQHCGLTGDVRNCQTMVMLTYATADGHAFIDRHLYLPEEWTNDRRRCREAGVPDEIVFATSPSSPSRCPRGPARCTCRSHGCWPTPATAVIRSFGPGATTTRCRTCSASPSTSRSTDLGASRASLP